MTTARGRRMKAGDCGRKPGVLISSPCLSHHQETNHVPLKTSATPTGWLHGHTSEDVWRAKWKEPQKNVAKATFVYYWNSQIFYACVEFYLGYAAHVNGRWVSRPHSDRTRCIWSVYSLLLKRRRIYLNKNKQTFFWPQLPQGISLFRKWKCQLGIVIILRVNQPLTL